MNRQTCKIAGIVALSPLALITIPSRAKFPIKVTVVAWQYGNSAKFARKSAESVERSVLIFKQGAR